MKKLEDFVLDRSFRKWALNPDKESNHYWEEYIRNHPNQARLIEEARKITLQLPRLDYRLSEVEVINLWLEISKSLDDAPLQRNKVVPLNQDSIIGRYSGIRKSDYSHFGRYAAAIIILIAFVSAWLVVKKTGQRQEEIVEEWIIKEVSAGQKSAFFLSDGTEIILNSGSSIKFLKGFTPIERIVYLQGEAFFNVSKDTLRLFQVIAGDIITQALGTSFNVSAYNPSQNVDVSLVSGKVAVRSGSKSIPDVSLLPGEKAVYKINEKDFIKSIFDPATTIGWKDRLLAFKDANQTEVFEKLTRWYGVSFQFENLSAKEWNYNGEFKNLDLKNVLGSIAFAMDFNYSINDSTVIIQFKNP